MRLPGRFWRFLTASGSANLTDGVFVVVLPLLTLSLTREPAAVAATTVFLSLPWLLLSLPAGAVADRVDRRRLLVAVAAGRVVVIGGLAAVVASGAAELWMVYLAAFLLGTGETVYDTTAQSMLPDLVDEPLLERANGRLYGAELVLNGFAGPPLGGLLAGLGLGLALAGSAAGYLVAALALLTLRGSFRPERATTGSTLRQDVREGLTYLWRHALLRRLALMVGATQLGFGGVLAVLALWAVAPGPMGLTEAQYGLLLLGTTVGGLVGSLTAERLQAALGRSLALRLSLVSFAVMLAAPLVRQPVAVAALSAIGACGVVLWNVITVSLRQRVVPNHLLGRVNAGYRTLSWGMQPVGAVLAGLVGQLLGLTVVFAVAGSGMLLLLIAARRLTDEVLSGSTSSTVRA